MRVYVAVCVCVCVSPLPGGPVFDDEVISLSKLQMSRQQVKQVPSAYIQLATSLGVLAGFHRARQLTTLRQLGKCLRNASQGQCLTLPPVPEDTITRHPIFLQQHKVTSLRNYFVTGTIPCDYITTLLH